MASFVLSVKRSSGVPTSHAYFYGRLVQTTASAYETRRLTRAAQGPTGTGDAALRAPVSASRAALRRGAAHPAGG